MLTEACKKKIAAGYADPFKGPAYRSVVSELMKKGASKEQAESQVFCGGAGMQAGLGELQVLPGKVPTDKYTVGAEAEGAMGFVKKNKVPLMIAAVGLVVLVILMRRK